MPHHCVRTFERGNLLPTLAFATSEPGSADCSQQNAVGIITFSSNRIIGTRRNIVPTLSASVKYGTAYNDFRSRGVKRKTNSGRRCLFAPWQTRRPAPTEGIKGLCGSEVKEGTDIYGEQEKGLAKGWISSLTNLEPRGRRLTRIHTSCVIETNRCSRGLVQREIVLVCG